MSEPDNTTPAAGGSETNHCKDCCCARSWKALGITDYTGKSICEHISELRADRDRLQAEAERLRNVNERCRMSCVSANARIASLEAELARYQQPGIDDWIKRELCPDCNYFRTPNVICKCGKTAAEAAAKEASHAK